MNSRLTPTDSFPEDLVPLEDIEIHVLHSRLQRQLDHEYAQNLEADPETVFRHEEVLEELDRRDAGLSLSGPLRTSMVGS